MDALSQDYGTSYWMYIQCIANFHVNFFVGISVEDILGVLLSFVLSANTQGRALWVGNITSKTVTQEMVTNLFSQYVHILLSKSYVSGWAEERLIHAVENDIPSFDHTAKLKYCIAELLLTL